MPPGSRGIVAPQRGPVKARGWSARPHRAILATLAELRAPGLDVRAETTLAEHDIGGIDHPHQVGLHTVLADLVDVVRTQHPGRHAERDEARAGDAHDLPHEVPM